MGGYLASLRVRITAQIDELKQRLGIADKLITAFAAAAVAALLAVGAAAVAAGVTMDDALDTIRISTGATGDALAGLEQDFVRVFTSGPDAAGVAAQALSDLHVRTGQTGRGLQDLAQQELTLARITKSDVGATVADTTRLFGDWGIAVQQQAGTLDQLYRASQATGIGVNALSSNLVKYGAPLRQFGFSFAESAAMMGKFEKEGVNTELVLGSLRIALGKFAKAGKEPPAALRETIAKIRQLGPSAAATSLAMEVFGKRAGADMAAAILEGRFAIDGLVEQIQHGSETIQGAAAQTDGLTETFARMRNVVVSQLGALALPGLEALNELLTSLMENGDAVRNVVYRLGQALVVLASIALGRLVPSLIAATVALVAQAAAFLSTATAAGVLAGAVTALKGALAFFGGPWGIAIAAALAAVGLAFLSAGKKASDGARSMEDAARRAEAALAVMTDAAVSQAFVGAVGATEHGRENVRRQNEMVLAMEARAKAGEAVFRVERQLDPMGRNRTIEVQVPTAFGQQLSAARQTLGRYRADLRMMEAEQERFGAESHARIQAQARLNASTAAVVTTGIGEGAAAGAGADAAKSAIDRLRESVEGLVSRFTALRAAGVNTGTMAADLIDTAATLRARIAAVSDVAALNPDQLKSYDTWLDLLTAINAALAKSRGSVFANMGMAGMAASLIPAALAAAQKNFAEKMGRVADKLHDAIKEGAKAGAERLLEAAKALREVSLGATLRGAFQSQLSGVAQQFANTFQQTAAARRAAATAKLRPPAFAQLPPIPNAAAMVVASKLLEGIMSEMSTGLDALSVPVVILGETIGKALLPIMEAAFPVFKALAIAAATVAQVLTWVWGHLSHGLGVFLEGVGRLLNALPGSLGAPIVRLGRYFQTMGDAHLAASEQLGRARRELEDLSWQDAMDRVRNGADAASSSLYNFANSYRRLEDRLWRTRDGFSGVRQTDAGPSRNAGVGSGGANQGATPATASFTVGPGAIVITGVTDPAQVARQVVRELGRLALAQLGDSRRWNEVVVVG